jgi:tRNA A-37 threonylcarbamoyl transferase component Bud32
VRLDFGRYQKAHGRLSWTSIALVVGGAVGTVFSSFGMLLGVLMMIMTKGGMWERRAGFVLAIFTGVFPLLASVVMVWRGIVRRGKLTKLRDLGALARQMPAFGVAEVARALDVGPAEAHRLVLDTMTAGILVDDGARPADPMARTISAPRVEPRSGPDAWIGAIIHGTYRVESRLGAGGMGLVYRAAHLRTGRPYAIKTLLADPRLTPDALRRFEREATAASALGHPNIIGVHDFNVTPEGAYYMVMDLLEGETLEQRLARVGSLAWDDARKIALELASALALAHDHGLLHRDLKPANVLLARSGTSERAVLLDFGLVKPLEDAAVASGFGSAPHVLARLGQSRITVTGAAVGTPMYMSPEQARGEAVDARSDVYGLAAVIYEMVTGAPPFLDRTLAQVYARLLTTPPPDASMVADRPIPPGLDALLARGLAKDPSARFPEMRAFSAAMQAVAPLPSTLAAGART